MSKFPQSIEIGKFTQNDSDDIHPLTLNALKWAKDVFDSPKFVNPRDMIEDLSSDEITSIRAFYSGSEKLNHYSSLNDLLKKLKK